MLYSVSRYVRGLVDGLAMPEGIPGPLVARITPPIVERMSAPRAHVWGGRLLAKRQTAPRGAGFMEMTWLVDLWVCYISTPDAAFQDEPFPQVTDAVLKVFMTATMPLFIDSKGAIIGPNATGPGQTQILAIGENFDADYPPERSITGNRMLWYVQHQGIQVKEVVQA